MKLITRVVGLTDSEVSIGISHLIKQLAFREWLQPTSATWDSGAQILTICADYNIKNLEFARRALLDEVQDLVVASFRFQSDLKFSVEPEG